MPSEKSILVWLRRDLRIQDNLVLKAAAGSGGPVIPVFIGTEDLRLGSASRWWLQYSLKELHRDLLAGGSRLILRKGDALQVLTALIKETRAGAVLWDKSFEPVQRKTDAKIRACLTRQGIVCEETQDALLFDPARILNQQGTPFKVFTPFWNHCLSLKEPAAPEKFSVKLPAPSSWPRSLSPEKFGPISYARWAKKMKPFWQPGSRGALKALSEFLDGKLEGYPEGRDLPAIDGTSRLSPYLHFGEISVREVWHRTQMQRASDRRPGTGRAAEAFLRQIVWREFAHYQLFHFPEMVTKPFRKEFFKFTWKKNEKSCRAWQKGMTGYPLVDAGMRQLSKTGWMHNRVRMIAASFLVKDLLQSWQEGAAWFMKTLADASLANNTFGWQWVAGCGADAAPYFRIFNPVLQGKKFDPKGDYVRRWVPELSGIPERWIHEPWRAPREVHARAGVRLGRDYPFPVVDHEAARRRALVAYRRI